MSESAFIVEVAEAEARVGTLRWQFDPVAKLGVPAHITVLYPFMDPTLIDTDVLSHAAEVIAESSAFEFSIERVERFPGVVYLAPEPADSFVQLTQRLTSRFPEYRPYGGRFSEVVPHLTVAHGSEEQLESAREVLSRDTEVNRRVISVCKSVSLIENSSGIWRHKHTFLLAR